jgi:hypothetical protein
VTWAKSTLVVGAGYVTGLLLTSLSIVWSPINYAVMAILRIPIDNWRHGLPRNDEIAAKDKKAGGTLAKMQAEATLCQNLFCAFLLLVVLNSSGAFLIPAVNALRPTWVVLLVLGLAGIFRTTVYLGRQSHLYELYILKPAPAGSDSKAHRPTRAS